MTIIAWYDSIMAIDALISDSIMTINVLIWFHYDYQRNGKGHHVHCGTLTFWIFCIAVSVIYTDWPATETMPIAYLFTKDVLQTFVPYLYNIWQIFTLDNFMRSPF